MTASSPHQSCALHYVPEAYSGDKPFVVGRQSAGSGFIDALVTHGGYDIMNAIVDSDATFAAFQQRIARIDPRIAVQITRPWDMEAMARAGTVFTPSPIISDSTWIRRCFRGDHVHSICGITHSVASVNVVRSIRDLMICPTQPWDALICTSRSAKRAVEQVIEHWISYLDERAISAARPAVQMPEIPLGVDPDRFAPTDAALAAGKALRERLQIAPDDIVVLYFGRLDFRTKQHPTPLFRAVELAAHIYRKSNIHLLMVGQFGDPVSATTFPQAQRLHAPNVRTVWVNGLEHETAQATWAAADIFLSLSDNVQESFGLTPLEAMAAGLPCVVSDWNGYRETVVDGETGFLIPSMMAPAGSGVELAEAFARHALEEVPMLSIVAQSTAVDIDRCAAALARLAEHGDLRRAFGQRARERAMDEFGWSRIIARYQDLWSELAAIRTRAAESATTVSRTSSFHPDYPDPFTMFAAHPSRELDERMIVGWGDADSATALNMTNMLTIDQSSEPAFMSAGEQARLLTVLADRSMSVRALADAFADTSPPRLHRTLMRLYKFGILTIRDADAAEATDADP